MALAVPEISVSMANAIEKIRAYRGECRLLSLGYPDVLHTKQKLLEIFSETLVEKCEFNSDSGGIWRWHGYHDIEDEPMVDAMSFFKALGATEVVAVDIVASRNIERIVDLNNPLPEDFHDYFDIIIDPGTIEHCFNCAQAMKSIAESIRLGGYIFTSGPMNLYNHGFYSFNPTLYIDFYGQNGFDVIDIFGIHGGKDYKIVNLKTANRFNDAPVGCTIGAIVKKIEEREISWPTQSKYIVNSNLIG